MRWTKWTLAALVACGLAAAPVTAQQAPSVPQARFVVVLDAAHGGDETGGRLTNGQYEKTFTLALTMRLRSLLGRAASRSSPPANRMRPLSRRSARRSPTTLLPRPAEPARLRERLWRSPVCLFAGACPACALPRWKTAQGAWVARSLKLAGVVNSALLQAGMSTTLSRTTLPAVDSMTCPAVAVEIAPERSTLHETTAGLGDPDYQARVATALAAALVEWRTEARQP